MKFRFPIVIIDEDYRAENTSGFGIRALAEAIEPPYLFGILRQPGIPLLIPGERFNATIVRYLKFARHFNEQFPGFETDIHGLVKEVVDGKARYFVDCVR